MSDSNTILERVKELTCLYRVSNLDEKELSPDQLLREAVQYLREAVQFPGYCVATAIFEGNIIRTQQSEIKDPSIRSSIKITSGTDLELILHYDALTEKENRVPDFLDEEKALLESVCRQLASKINWILARKELDARHRLQERSYLNANIGSWEYDFKKSKLYLSDLLKALLETDENLDADPADLFQFIVDQKDRGIFKAEIKESVELQKPFSRELQVEAGNGRLIWMKIIVDPVFENGECIKLFGTVQNIEQRKQTEIALSKRNQFIETALEHLPLGIAINTISDGKSRLMNQKFSKIYGWSEKDVTDVETFFKKVYPDKTYRKKIATQIREDMESGDASRMNWEGIEITRKSGEKRIVNAKNIPVYDQNLMISTVTDVTKHFRAEEQLRDNEQRFKALVQDGSDLIAILNLNGEFTYVSPTSEMILGIKPENAMGKKMIDYIHEDDQDRIKEIMNNLPHQRRFVIKQVRFKSEENRYKWLEASVTNMLREPSVEGFVINAHDITERISHQNEIKKALAEKEVLLSEIHHRVKNNLAVISGMMQLQLYEETKPEVQTKLTDGILRIQTMANIHELLYNTKNFAALSFEDIIRRLSKNVKSAMCNDKEVAIELVSDGIELNLTQAIPCSLIVNEVLTNIFKHAFVGRKKGNIDISIFENSKRISLVINDDGVGLPEDFSIDEGSSLGKNIIKILCEQLEGDFRLFSPEIGTTFELHFKASESQVLNNS